jgi:hypothetical protein
MLDTRGDDWIVTAGGDYSAVAVQAAAPAAVVGQELVALQWPGRRNHTDQQVTVRLLMAPEDALGLAQVLAHTARWVLSRGGVGPGKAGG